MKDLKIFTNNIEKEAIEQIELLLSQDSFKNSKVRIMPDVHSGKGCVIGFTGDLGSKVIPNIVGVDIGCGMLCINLGKIEIDLKKLDDVIHNFVPSGFEVHDFKQIAFPKLQELKCYRELKDTKRLERSIGTLGGGNHFIEVDIDEQENKYLIIHSGSRNLGKQVAEYYQNMADQLCNYNYEEYFNLKNDLIEKLKLENRKSEIQTSLETLKKDYQVNLNQVPKDLAFLEGKYRDEYLHDMKISQEFAVENRKQIAKEILENYFGDETFNFSELYTNHSFETIHNYISFDDNIVRKGAISAKKGETVLIPLNMRDGCIIAVGKGNDDWNQSAPHGAGRIMSRSKAKDVVNLSEYEESMKGIFSTSVNEFTKDEAPMIYKPMEEILQNIKDTVEIVKVIKPIYNYKSST